MIDSKHIFIGVAFDHTYKGEFIFHRAEIFSTGEDAVEFCKHFGGVDTTILKGLIMDSPRHGSIVKDMIIGGMVNISAAGRY